MDLCRPTSGRGALCGRRGLVSIQARPNAVTVRWRDREPKDVTIITEILAQIEAPHFTAGIVLWDDKVVEAAPIVRKRLLGQKRSFVRKYCADQGWRISIIHEIKRQRTFEGKDDVKRK